MSSFETPPAATNRDEWWLCSHLVSIVVPEREAEASPALLEEISSNGVRFALDKSISEATTVVLQTGDFEAPVVVKVCRVRADDFQVEARFARNLQWTPDLWRPEHLYRPPRRDVAAKGAAGA